MAPDPQHVPMFRIDVSADSSSGHIDDEMDAGDLIVALLRQLMAGQERQTEVLKELNAQMGATQRQRSHELTQWKNAHPNLAEHCRTAAETLSQVQTNFLEKLTEEVLENDECLMDSEFMMHEFVDRFGPRMAHLNGVLQVLSQLSGPQTPPPKSPR